MNRTIPFKLPLRVEMLGDVTSVLDSTKGFVALAFSVEMLGDVTSVLDATKGFVALAFSGKGTEGDLAWANELTRRANAHDDLVYALSEMVLCFGGDDEWWERAIGDIGDSEIDVKESVLELAREALIRARTKEVAR